MVDRNAIVPLYFRKSKWAPIAMLAVMKPGSALVMMDSRQPPERMNSVLEQIKRIVFIMSAGNEKLMSSLSDELIIVLSDNLMREIASSVVTETILPRVQPLDRLYLIFTSGSAGTPKGASTSHSNVCSALRYQTGSWLNLRCMRIRLWLLRFRFCLGQLHEHIHHWRLCLHSFGIRTQRRSCCFH